MTQPHLAWLAKWQREVEEEYGRLHAVANQDPQQSGHGGEATWQRLLEEWLPPAYEVGTRKYIVPEEGSDVFETDLVIFNPGYPRRLRSREHVLAGGVAAAFSVKLTLDPAGLRDACERAALLRRATKIRHGSPRSELLGAFAVGVLAHSHTWTRPRSTPRENLKKHLWEVDHAVARHPRESLDLLCVADLATVTTQRMPYLGPDYFRVLDDEQVAGFRAAGIDPEQGMTVTAMSMSDEENEPGHIAMLVAALINRLAMADPTVLPFADGLRVTNTLGSGGGVMRPYPLHAVYSEQLLSQRHRFGTHVDWAMVF